MKRRPDSAASCSNAKGLEMSGPPEKKRKTSQEPPEQLWDDNDDFTQDQLQNIDDFIVASQVPAAGAQFTDPRDQQSNRSSKRSHDYQGGQMQTVPQGQPSSSKAQRERHSPNPVYTFDPSSLSPFTMGSRSEGYHTLTGEGSAMQAPAVQSKSTLKPSSAAQHAPLQTSSKGIPSKGSEGDDNFQMVLQKELEKSKKEFEHIKKEYQKVKDCQFTQDGQIKMLRTTLAAKESELAKYKLQKVQELDQEARERTQREKAQENEIERLKSQLQFKEREVVELKNMYQRKLVSEKQNNATDSQRSGNSQGTTANNQRTHGNTQSPKPGKGGFPTTESFQGSQKPQKAKNKQKSVDSPAKTACTSTSTEASTSYRVARSRDLTLGVRNPRGQVCGSKLVSQLMSFDGASTSESASAASTFTRELQGIVKLLEPPLQALNLSGLKFGRDRNMLLSPIASCRTQQSIASSSSSGSCSIDYNHANSTINLENYSLAQQSITALLQPSTCRYNHGHPPELLGTDTTQALSLLPLVEDYVSRYIDMMYSTAEPVSQTPPESLQSWGGSLESSGETVSSSVQSFMMGRASYVNKLEDITLTALQVLDRVVGVSLAVRHALVCDKENGMHNFSSMFHPMEIDMEEAGPSRQADVVGNPSAGQNNACNCSGFNTSSLDGSLHRIVQDCHLMQKILKLANPLHFNNRVGNSQITAACLSVLNQLASSCSTEEVEKFQPLVTQESLANCLLEDLNVPATDRFRLAHSAVRLLSVIVRSETVMRSMCSQHESCLLSAIYRSSSSWRNEEKTDLCKQMIQLLCSLISLHKTGPSVLLESNCHCSTQIIRSIILALYDALQSYHKERSSDLLSLLRQGASLLCSLSQHDPLYLQHRHGVEHQYVFLVCGLDAAFKEANVPGEEVNLVYEQLWDFDQDYPESGGEEAEAEPQRPENNNHKTDRPSAGKKAPVEVIELD